MTTSKLYQELQYVNHSREKRIYYSSLVIDNPKLIDPLLEILFTVDDKLSCKAAWVFEFMCSKQLEAIIPHLDKFTENVSTVHYDSAVRPMAKVCEYLITTYYSGKDHLIKDQLSERHKEKIIEACFDWMINDEKIAPKAYSMNCLYLLGTEYPWIHPELAVILERDYEMQSSGFKARAKHILKRIKS
ncbi:hypothetical protein DFQ11_103205 [Winogradskyella epiphytica]|uniref:Adenylosuccinate lyase n=1 Tax=Winogradskyella epiphytica TaxID=262005 RepID=A0A2V4XEW3_9FLAO|nr:hypothetical protein DFQ11_103205 [Winogradskyella epiphytica]